MSARTPPPTFSAFVSRAVSQVVEIGRLHAQQARVFVQAGEAGLKRQPVRRSEVERDVLGRRAVVGRARRQAGGVDTELRQITSVPSGRSNQRSRRGRGLSAVRTVAKAPPEARPRSGFAPPPVDVVVVALVEGGAAVERSRAALADTCPEGSGFADQGELGVGVQAVGAVAQKRLGRRRTHAHLHCPPRVQRARSRP